MRRDLTDLTIVMDRSGSMEGMKTEAEQGLDALIEKQKLDPGECLFTLIQFDTEYDVVVRGAPINTVPKITLTPRGLTALHDAVGRTILDTGKRLEAMKEEDRPGLVVMIVLTDGLDNSSREYTKARVKAMVEHQKNAYTWQFMFLGCGLDAYQQGATLGFSTNADYSNYSGAVAAASGNVTRMKGAVMTCSPIRNAFTDEELKDMKSTQ